MFGIAFSDTHSNLLWSSGSKCLCFYQIYCHIKAQVYSLFAGRYSGTDAKYNYKMAISNVISLENLQHIYHYKKAVMFVIDK